MTPLAATGHRHACCRAAAVCRELAAWCELRRSACKDSGRPRAAMAVPCKTECRRQAVDASKVFSIRYREFSAMHAAWTAVSVFETLRNCFAGHAKRFVCCNDASSVRLQLRRVGCCMQAMVRMFLILVGPISTQQRQPWGLGCLLTHLRRQQLMDHLLLGQLLCRAAKGGCYMGINPQCSRCLLSGQLQLQLPLHAPGQRP